MPVISLGGGGLWLAAWAVSKGFKKEISALFPPEFPVGDWAVKVTMVAAPALIFLGLFLLLEWLRLRYGRCEIQGHLAAFSSSFASALGGPSVKRVDLRDVKERRLTPHGVLLTFRGRFWIGKTHLIPADEWEQTEVIAILDEVAELTVRKDDDPVR